MCSTVSVCFNYSTSFSNDDFSSSDFDNGGGTSKKRHTKFKIIVQIYKLPSTVLKTKARVVKANRDLLQFVLQVNQSKISHWNPREKTV